MVNSPADAYRCFMGTDLDALAIGNFLLLKDKQNLDLRKTYHDSLEKD
jgi:carbamoyltransferase